jgi:hypothetical protein
MQHVIRHTGSAVRHMLVVKRAILSSVVRSIVRSPEYIPSLMFQSTSRRVIVNNVVSVAVFWFLAAVCHAQTPVELQPGTITGTIQISEPLYSSYSSVTATNVADNSSTSVSFSGNTYSIIVPAGKTYRLRFYLYVNPNAYLEVRPADQIAVALNETVTKNYTYLSTRIIASVSPITGGTFVRFDYLQNYNSMGDFYVRGWAYDSDSVPTLTSVTTSINGSVVVNTGSRDNVSISLPTQSISVGTTPASVSWAVTAPVTPPAPATGKVQGSVSVLGDATFSFADIYFANGYQRMTTNGSYEFTDVPVGTYGGYGYFYFTDRFIQLYRTGAVTAGNITEVNFSADVTSASVSLDLTGFLSASKISYGYIYAYNGNDYLSANYKPLTSSFLPLVPLGAWRFPYVYVQANDNSDPQNSGYVTIGKNDYLRGGSPIIFAASAGAVPPFSLNVAQTELIFDVIEAPGSQQETMLSNPQISGRMTTKNAAGAVIAQTDISAYSYSTNRAKPKLKIMGEPGTYTIQPSARIGNQNINFGAFQLTLELPLLTPVGTEVVVEPIPNVWVQFDEVTAVGVTTASILPSGPQLSQGRSVLKRNNEARYYNISTTALFDGSAEVTITYDPSEITPEQEENLKIFHYDETSAQWIDITISIDTVNNRITGVTPGFSLFVVAYTNSPLITQLNAPGGQRGIPFAFTAQFTDADGNDQHTATWSWGDGSQPNIGAVSPGSISVSHTFAQRGTFNGLLTITDATGNSATRPFAVTVTAVPVADPQTVTLAEDVARTINLTGTDAITFSLASQPQHGTLNGSAPSLTYTPNPNYTGPDGFTFKVNDGAVDSAAATVSINVTPVNDAPLASGQSITIPEDTPAQVTLGGSDVDHDPLTFSIVSTPANGVLSGSAPNFTYTPNPNFNGADTFTFKATDSVLESNVVTISIAVTAVDDRPIAEAIATSTPEDTAVAITLTGTDADSIALTYIVATEPAHGTLSGTAPNLTYTPAANYHGSDSFTYKATDGTQDSVVVSVLIAVTSVNDIPAATPQPVTMAEDSPRTVTLAGTDADGDTLSYAIVTGPAHGALSGNGANVSYTPALNYNGADSFTFKVNDGTVDSVPVTVSITVTPVNDAPILAAVGDRAIAEQTTLSFSLTASDVDAGDALTFLIDGPTPAGMALSAAGAFSWTPSEAQGPGSYAVVFRVADNGSASISDTETVTITVNEVNRAPSFVSPPGNKTIEWGSALTFDLAADDPDLPANALIFSLGTGAPVGAAIDPSTGVFTWTPDSGQIGGHTITFQVIDNGNLPLSVAHTITVNVGKRATSLMYGGDVSADYSDKPGLKAALMDALTNTAISGATIGFTVGSQTAPVAATNGAGLAASGMLALTQPPGAYDVTSTFAGDAFYFAASDHDPFTITPEEAVPVVYSGGTYFGTANSSSISATLALSASATDISDGSRGDIRNGKLEFRLGSPAGALIGGPSAANLPIGLVNPGDLTVGTATTPSFLYTLSNTELNDSGTSFSVYSVVNGFYLGDEGPELITISVPGSENVSGGGYIVIGASAGLYAAKAGSKCNFGLTMKYNRSGRNLQGQSNIIFRGGGKIYQVKSNAIDSLATNGTSYPRQATIVTKANLTDITNPLAPVSIGGNLSLLVQMIDNGTGGATDQIAVSLTDNGGGVLFSSNWSGTKTEPQTLGGGNISVR